MSRSHLPSLSAMQCFEAAARHLSFTQAARELNLTQSAVSKQVAQLEVILGRKLFQRIRKRLQVTPEGSLYLSEVRKILTQVDISTRYMRSYQDAHETLNIATLPTFGARWLIPRLNGFRFRHPSILLNIGIRLEPFDFETESIDIAFFHGRGIWPKAECIKLLDEEVVPVCAPALMPAQGVSSALDLTRLVLMQSATRPAAWHLWFEAQGLYAEHSYRGPKFETFDMSLRAARVGCGVALVPRFLVEEEVVEGKLVIPWPFAYVSRDAYYMAYPENYGAVPKVRSFVDWLLERCDEERSRPASEITE